MILEIGLTLMITGVIGIYLSSVLVGCEPCGEHAVSTFITVMSISITIIGIIFGLAHIIVVLGLI